MRQIFGTFLSLSFFITAVTVPAEAGMIEAYVLKKARDQAVFVQHQLKASPLANFIRRMRDPDAPVLLDVVEGVFQQRINHSDPADQRTFSQRYFLNSTYAKGANAPVIFNLCGEAVCGEGDLAGAVSEHAEKLGAHLVTLEHRYYGRSQPFTALTAENMQYLSMAQALADNVAFQAFLTEKLGTQGPWVVVGGSYAGALAAFQRLKNPENFAGALNSSGPVLAKADFEEYDFTVNEAAGPVCAAAIRNVVRKVEASLKDNETRKAMKTLFQSAKVENDVDFLYIVADMASAAVQYGFRKEFCGALESPDPVKGYAEVGAKVMSLLGMTPEMDTPDWAMSTDPKKYESGLGNRAWWYQSCTEFGFYQVAYPDASISTRSARIDLPYHHAICRRLFDMTKPVDTARTNAEYYEPLLQVGVTNILHTNGSTDPWSKLSFRDGSLLPNATQQAYLIEGGSHCSDLSNTREKDSASLVGARVKFEQMAADWLK